MIVFRHPRESRISHAFVNTEAKILNIEYEFRNSSKSTKKTKAHIAPVIPVSVPARPCASGFVLQSVPRGDGPVLPRNVPPLPPSIQAQLDSEAEAMRMSQRELLSVEDTVYMPDKDDDPVSRSLIQKSGYLNIRK